MDLDAACLQVSSDVFAEKLIKDKVLSVTQRKAVTEMINFIFAECLVRNLLQSVVSFEISITWRVFIVHGSLRIASAY